jgi:hypothetical protein
VERPDSLELANIDRPERIIHGQASNGSTGFAAASEFHFSEDVLGRLPKLPCESEIQKKAALNW